MKVEEVATMMFFIEFTESDVNSLFADMKKFINRIVCFIEDIK